ncbi:hypothetical protein sscle_03g024450 [Sclerotinia sclerotiorum 1980 UF-70]|uniref:Uncharacterized protein n=1 Tax=Sclerotinia sclerotiorum (strain ATCC 18683 / 1980 / Ss-1) TaxID=665079 RepID=A0A1D9PY70_SCLS1|nr:hypothetical protein sscle_03g024450 [Sclerotinia sclerotiorum 1980 UF-70]
MVQTVIIVNTSNEEFDDISKDIELETLPTINPQAIKKASSNKPKKSLISKLKNPFENPIYLPNAILTSAISMAITIPICLSPLYTNELKWTVSVVFKNIAVINGTVDYRNGTIAPLNDVNLVGSNLTVQTFNFVETADFCTNNMFHYFDVWWPCFALFVVLLNLSIWHFVTLRCRSVVVRYSEGREH